MNILFVCNGNVARSQEAEVFFNAASKINSAKSAGVNAILGKPLNPLVIEVMAELGYSLNGNFRKLVDKELVDEADLIVSFKPEDELPESMRNHKNLRYWTVDDPQNQPVEFFRTVRDAVQLKVDELVKEIG